jgi:hypothetical protein
MVSVCLGYQSTIQTFVAHHVIPHPKLGVDRLYLLEQRSETIPGNAMVQTLCPTSKDVLRVELEWVSEAG